MKEEQEEERNRIITEKKEKIKETMTRIRREQRMKERRKGK